MKIHWNLEQRSPSWYKIRSGIPTASEFSQIITPAKGDLSKSRFKLACKLIAARLLNWEPRQVDTEDMRNGREREPEAIQHLEFVHDLTTQPVGFVTTDDGRIGASPDRFLTATTTPVEIKSPSDPVMLEYLLLGHGDDYRPQVQGQIYICESDEALFFGYNPRTPEYFVRTHRDEEYIRKLASHLGQFSDELDMLVEKARSLGLYQAYADAPDDDLPDLIEGDEGLSEVLARRVEDRT